MRHANRQEEANFQLETKRVSGSDNYAVGGTLSTLHKCHARLVYNDSSDSRAVVQTSHYPQREGDTCCYLTYLFKYPSLDAFTTLKPSFMKETAEAYFSGSFTIPLEPVLTHFR